MDASATGVIGANEADARIWYWPATMLRSSTTSPHPGDVVGHGPGPAIGRIRSEARRQESRSMIRQTAIPATESDVEDRSMRLVEYAMAFVAVLAAGILAFIR
jgi:hypothetical protein